jgi:hypothetical protein
MARSRRDTIGQTADMHRTVKDDVDPMQDCIVPLVSFTSISGAALRAGEG